ncbi:MAG: histidine kinase [Chitinophagales bacterium]|nr:histidine kinase [Chitinophagales bacterium]
MSVIKKFLFCIFFFAYTNIYAQADITHYTTNKGLPSNYIIKTLTDNKGFLWIATINGLCRFDGINFTIYKHNPSDSNSLRSNWITDILVDNDGILWITTEWGICHYNYYNDNFSYLNKIDELYILYKAPMCLDDKGNIWVAFENGLYFLENKTKKLKSTSLKNIADPQSIAYFNNKIYISTRGNGLYYYEVASNQYKIETNKILPKQTHIMHLFVQDKKMWMATDIGIVELSNNHYTLYNKFENERKVEKLMCINKIINNDSILLCGSYGNEIYIFNKYTNKFTGNFNKEAFPNTIVNNFFTQDKNIWIATDRGLFKVSFSDRYGKTINIPFHAEDKNKLVTNIIQLNSSKQEYTFLCGKKNAKIATYNIQTKKFFINKEFPNNKSISGYNCLYQYKDFYWAAGDSVLDLFNAKHNRIKHYTHSYKTISLYVAKNDFIWIGTDKGLLQFNDKTQKFKFFEYSFLGTSIENSSFSEVFPITAITEDSKGILWLVSIKYGLFSFDINKEIFTPYRQKTTLAYNALNRISSIAIDNDDNIWLGTMGGITCYQPLKNSFKNYNSEDGLTSTYVYSIAIGFNNRIWGRGNEYIFAFDRRDSTFINLPSEEYQNRFYFIQTLSKINSNILCGFEGGFTIYNTNNNYSIHKPQHIVINKVSVFEAPNPDFSKNAVFKYYNDNIQISFTCPQFDNNNPYQYRYRLVGLDKNWLYTGTIGKASYNNIQPGKYSFEVQVSVGNKWSKSEKLLAFTIQPAFWQTWWFKTLAIILSVFLVIFITYSWNRNKLKSIEAQNKAREKEIELKLKDQENAELQLASLRSQMNPHFIFNSLNSIQKYIWENKQEDANEYLTKFAKLMRLILEHSSKKLITLEEELTALKLYLELEHRRCNNKFDYSLIVDDSIEKEKIIMPPLLIQPHVENAIWHGLLPKETRGKLQVNIKLLQAGIIECLVEDDGIGREASNKINEKKHHKHNSIAINIAKERLKVSNSLGLIGKLEVIDLYNENKESKGTKVILQIPIEYFEKIK